MSEFAQNVGAECYPKCTYSLTNTHLIPQPIYICHTCNDSLCCCVGCSRYCHDGHDIDFFAHGKAYCDCGADSYGITCNLSLSSSVSASTIFGNNLPITSDDDGRIGNTTATNLTINDFSTHEYNIIMNNDNSINNSMIDTFKEQCISLAHMTKDTFWINSSSNPRNPLEKHALEIFHYHTQGSVYNNDISGAEFWVQIKNDDGGIDLHYDKDEEIAAIFELGIFPQISTVTYLSSSMKTPTVVYKKTNDNNINNDYNESSIQNCWLSFPNLNKHISFDGRYLHGAPSIINQYINNNDSDSNSNNSNDSNDSNSNIRVTFLVNIWLNHHPYNINPMSSDIMLSMINSNHLYENMNTTIVLKMSSQPPTLLVVTDELVSQENNGAVVTIPFISNDSQWGKDVNQTGIVLNMWLPKNYLGLNDNTFAIKYDDDIDACYLEYELDEDEFLHNVENGMNLI